MGEHNPILERELSRFFAVACSEASRGADPSAMAMPDCVVDDFWHARDDDAAFAEATRRRFGASITHINDYEKYPDARGQGLLRWVPAYEAQFGKLHAVWFTHPTRGLDIARYEAYLAGTPVLASWNCRPKVTPLPKRCLP
jgi:hypothetical protein